MTSARLAVAAIVILAVLNIAQFLKRPAPEPPPPSSQPTASEPAPTAASIDAMIAQFARFWSVKQGFYKQNHWLDVQTMQNPMDAWVTQEIITEVRPDVIIEAGTYKGGSALMWAVILSQVTPDGKIITMDVKDRTGKASRHPIWSERIEFLHGSSTAPEIVAKVRERVEGKRVLVILDSLHTRDHVYDELQVYARMVPVGGYVIVQDTGFWKAGVSKLSGASQAVVDFIAETDDFVIDRSRERFVLTNNPDGFLKRVK